MTKPYTFQPVYDIQGVIDLVKSVRENPKSLSNIKHGCGITGCAIEKLDDEPESIGSRLVEVSASEMEDATLEEICDEIELQAKAARSAGEGFSPILNYLITLLLNRLFKDVLVFDQE